MVLDRPHALDSFGGHVEGMPFTLGSHQAPQLSGSTEASMNSAESLAEVRRPMTDNPGNVEFRNSNFEFVLALNSGL